MTAPHRTARAVELGFALKKARERAGLTQEKAAESLRRNRSHVSRFERGQLVPSPDDVAAMLDLYKVTGALYDHLMRMAHEAANADWIVPGVDRNFAALMAVERDARRIVNVQPLRIPGPLQTEAYARAIMAGAGLTPEQAEERVRLRMNRQTLLLERGDAPEYLAIIGEFALRFPPCDQAAMADQLRKLLTIGKRPNVPILVLPARSGLNSPALEGAFVLVDLLHGDSQVHHEGLRGASTLTNKRDVRDYQAAVNVIRRQAMGRAKSAALIAELLEQMEGGLA